MQVPFVTLDVFTDRRFGGNPLAVILDARGLADADMQAIAREFNYSEQTFVLPPADPAHTARVRIFTPSSELPFAGHPNVGTAVALARAGAVFGRPVGDALSLRGGGGPGRLHRRAPGRRARRPHRRAGPARARAAADSGLVAGCVGLPARAIVTARHPPRMASVGLPCVFAELDGLAALAAARPDAAAFAAAEAAQPAVAGTFSVALYVRTGPGGVRARVFAPLAGIAEDPATGSAAGALGALLASLGDGGELVVEQGVEMGRPSRIEVAVRGAAVTIAGPCVPVMEGTLTL